MDTKSPQFEAVFCTLVEYEVSSRTQALTRLVSSYNFLESLINKVAGRRLEVKKLIKGKTITLRAHIETAYAEIGQWINHPSVQRLGRRFSFKGTNLDTWALSDVFDHRFPWAHNLTVVGDARIKPGPVRGAL